MLDKHDQNDIIQSFLFILEILFSKYKLSYENLRDVATQSNLHLFMGEMLALYFHNFNDCVM